MNTEQTETLEESLIAQTPDQRMAAALEAVGK